MHISSLEVVYAQSPASMCCTGYCSGYLVYSPGHHSVFLCNRGCVDMQCMAMAGQHYPGAALPEPLPR